MNKFEKINSDNRQLSETSLKEMMGKANTDRSNMKKKIGTLSSQIVKEEKIKRFIREKLDKIKQLNDLYLQYRAQL